MSENIVRFTHNGYRSNIAQIDRDLQLKENLNLLWDTYHRTQSDVVFTALESVTKKTYPANMDAFVSYEECKVTLCSTGSKSFYGESHRYNNDDIVATIYVTRLCEEGSQELNPIISQNKPWPVYESLSHELGISMGIGLLTNLRDYTMALWDKGFRLTSFTADLNKVILSLRLDEIIVTINYYHADYRRNLLINSTI